jgi:hypothetical protein
VRGRQELAGVLAVLVDVGSFYNRQQQARWEAVRAQALRYGLSQLDALHHSRYEDAVRDLMRRDAQRVGEGGDLRADVKATDPFGRRWVPVCCNTPVRVCPDQDSNRGLRWGGWPVDGDGPTSVLGRGQEALRPS